MQELINAVELSFRERRWVSIPLDGELSVTALDRFFDALLSAAPGERDVHRRARVRRSAARLVAGGLAALDDEMQSLHAELVAAHPPPASASGVSRRRGCCSTPSSRARFSRSSAPRTRARTACAAIRRCGRARRCSRSSSLMIRDFAPVDERMRDGDDAARRDPRLSRATRTRRSATVPIPVAVDDARAARCEGAVDPARRRHRRTGSQATPGVSDRVPRLRAAAERASIAFAKFADWLSERPRAPRRADGVRRGRCSTCCSRAGTSARARARELLREARDAIRRGARRGSTRWRARSPARGRTAQAQIRRRPSAGPTTTSARSTRTWNACRETRGRARRRRRGPSWPIRYVPIPAWTRDAAPYLYYLYYRSPAPFDPYTTYDYVVPPLPTDAGRGRAASARRGTTASIKLNHVVHHGAIGHHVQNWHAYHRAPSRIGKIAAVDCASRIGMFRGGTMAEGWACYATDLMEELGFLTPLERVSEQHTRVRLLARAIVDIELHQGDDDVRRRRCASTIEQVGMSADAARAEAVEEHHVPVHGDHVLARHAGRFSTCASRDAATRRARGSRCGGFTTSCSATGRFRCRSSRG